eukprot:CAMPEP_0176377586 /NCGR_PEP_ID=MMETSP0126-20121128/28998_1 /TAXON_ID=141414 ORGANISM="Strombidinopsis acuminatum, Strain SPMC142" /NCGR_SAMPLE_ID=MMETSP0126 /ASSEMBLY_ACC=CAM_ASM_000229 /LENGTH=113 /DNA_ID=CAMNT_0017739495 /DNA_START=19 /DNA_END=360 /DNA_ORIENTATION=-
MRTFITAIVAAAFVFEAQAVKLETRQELSVPHGGLFDDADLEGLTCAEQYNYLTEVLDEHTSSMDDMIQSTDGSYSDDEHDPANGQLYKDDASCDDVDALIREIDDHMLTHEE